MGNGGKTCSYKMVPFLGAQGPSMQAKFILKEKTNRTSGRSIPPYKWRGDEKRWLMHTAPPFCEEKKSLEPNHSVGFLKTSRFIATKWWPRPLGVNFKGDIESMPICMHMWYSHMKLRMTLVGICLLVPVMLEITRQVF